MANRTTIEIYTRQKTFVHLLYGARRAHCRRCDTEVLLVHRESAARVFHLRPDQINQLIESELLHEITTDAGARLVCCNSLLTAVNSSEKEVQLKKS